MKKALWVACIAAGISISLNATAGTVDFGAGIQLDYATVHSDHRPLNDGLLLRRAKFNVDGKFNANWSFKFSYEGTDVYRVSNHGARRKGVIKDGIHDAMLSYRGWRFADLDVGQYKVPFGLEELPSSDNLSFIERSLPTNAFKLSRRIGVGLGRSRYHYTLSVMAFGRPINGSDDGRGVAARATFAPVRNGDTVLHLGVAAITEVHLKEIRIDTHPESRPPDIKLVDTDVIANVNRVNRLGLEAAWQSGPFSVQSEWMHAAVKRNHGSPDLYFHGGYIMGSWILSGQSRRYVNGEFKGISEIPTDGAWQLTGRYSRVDLDNGSVRGGREHDITLGITYYLNKRVRVMANYIFVHSQRHGIEDSPRILLLRVQLAI